MLEKWKNDPEKRDKLMKAAAVLIILAVIFLSFDVFTQNRDGRKQIIDSDGGTETELCSILSDIDGVGSCGCDAAVRRKRSGGRCHRDGGRCRKSGGEKRLDQGGHGAFRHIVGQCGGLRKNQCFGHGKGQGGKKQWAVKRNIAIF